jgi:hypothetical protein
MVAEIGLAVFLLETETAFPHGFSVVIPISRAANRTPR